MHNLDYYGGFLTRTFGEIFNSKESFVQAYNTCGIEKVCKEQTINNLFYLLYAEYGNSHIANAIDENQFVYNLFSIVFMYGPTWEKKLEIQRKVRELSLDPSSEIYKGGKAIYNRALNPGKAPGTSSLEELTYINEQNTTNYKKNILEGLANLTALLETDVTREFISRFRHLFINILAPNYPTLYKTEVSE